MDREGSWVCRLLVDAVVLDASPAILDTAGVASEDGEPRPANALRCIAVPRHAEYFDWKTGRGAPVRPQRDCVARLARHDVLAQLRECSSRAG